MLSIPPPVWTIVWMLIAAGTTYVLGWPHVPGLRQVPLAVVLIVLGITSAASAVLLFRREDTELNPTSTSNSKLVTSGPFRITRNPMYLGLVLVTLGIAFWAGAWPMFLAPIAIFATLNWVHIPFEEAKMRRQFGEAFESYSHKVRRWL
jgi:protein-S-isoprenylcysteine O-methyltransferase Ste14